MTSEEQKIIIEEGRSVLASSSQRLIVGSRTGCDLVINDPVVADQHCEFYFDGTFRVRDLDSVTGTYVDGISTQTQPTVEDGSEIVIGLTRLIASITERDGVPALVLQLELNAFHFARPRKNAFDNDPDRWVATEVTLGRFRSLSVANRVAIVVALVLLVASTVLSSVQEPLVDAGPLLCGHATVVAGESAPAGLRAAIVRFEKKSRLAREQSCEVCHADGFVSTEKCMQCHEDFREKTTWRHPFLGDGKLGDKSTLNIDGEFCVLCHADHTTSDGIKAYSDSVVGNCKSCHADDPQYPLPELKMSSRPIAPYEFGHDSHLAKGIDCKECHVPNATATALAEQGLDNQGLEDFATVPYETCAKCHVDDQLVANESWRPASKYRWNVDWHGSEDGASTCGRCHARADTGDGFKIEFRQVDRLQLKPEVIAKDKGKYSVAPRDHRAEFAAHSQGQACTTCHGDSTAAVLAGQPSERTFWHALHMPEAALLASTPDGEAAMSAKHCMGCHGDQKESTSLTSAVDGAWWRSEAESQKDCAECHKDGADKAIAMPPVPKTDWPTDSRRRTNDFPHSFHLTVQGGCFACHEFKNAGDGDPLQVVPTTHEKAFACAKCHSKHDNIAGGQCKVCHPSDAGKTNVYLETRKFAQARRSTSRPPRKTRPWPERNTFGHFSKGHVELDCAKCHDAQALKKAGTIDSIPLPAENLQLCRECHLKEQFHWR